MQIAILTISSLSLLTSATTLAIVLGAGKKVHTDVEDFKSKTNRNLDRIKRTLSEMEF